MLKLLIADDERTIRETISSLIDWEAMGIEIAGICPDGIAAYDCIMDEYPDIVLTDIKMPGLNGLELIEKVKDAQPDIEFVILSGYGEFEFAQSAMKCGVRHYLLKPCNEEDIIHVIQDCITTCQKRAADHINTLFTTLFSDEPNEAGRQKYKSLLLAQQDTDFIRTQLIRLMLADAKAANPHFSYLHMTEYMVRLNQCSDRAQLMEYVVDIMSTIFHSDCEKKYNDCVEKAIEYINEHLSDENLSLKWIAENYLYMNADYISKQFVRQTGSKFSTYLAELRVNEAKRLLLTKSAADSPYSVAQKVGFGNNPQYFSQIFKKYTHMTPSNYVKTMAGL